MKAEPCSLIIPCMPDTKHCIMYWKLLHSDTRLLKVSSKSHLIDSTLSVPPLLQAGIVLGVQTQEKHLINGACNNTQLVCLVNIKQDKEIKKTASQLMEFHHF